MSSQQASQMFPSIGRAKRLNRIIGGYQHKSTKQGMHVDKITWRASVPSSTILVF